MVLDKEFWFRIIRADIEDQYKEIIQRQKENLVEHIEHIVWQMTCRCDVPSSVTKEDLQIEAFKHYMKLLHGKMQGMILLTEQLL